jgi:hypothetical protein
MSHDFVYCGLCYITPVAQLKPFSMCYDCWVANGKPEAVKP